MSDPTPLRTVFTIQSKAPEKYLAWANVGDSYSSLRDASVALARVRASKSKWNGPGYEFRILQTVISVVEPMPFSYSPPNQGGTQR